uniref:Uncharacterized protein n=1 Tax=Arundo donax TaxID=35708 RepID=A0A0A9ADW7_ARUDO
MPLCSCYDLVNFCKLVSFICCYISCSVIYLLDLYLCLVIFNF